MKKTNVAAGVIIALGVIWTGAAWLTGKQLESRMDELVQNANQRLNTYAPDSRLKLSYEDYHRGVFRSRARLVVQASSQTEDNSLLKPGQSIVFTETIDHGPFPFAQLRHLVLIPSMASVHSELENSDAAKALFALADNQSPVKADTRIGYSGATDTELDLQPLNYLNAQTGQRLASNGGKVNLSVDSKGDKIALDGNVDSLTLTIKNSLGEPVQFISNGLNLKANTHLAAEGVRVGDQQLQIEKLQATVNGAEAILLQKLAGNSSFDEHEGKIAGNVDYSVNNIAFKGNDFGSGRINVKLSQFDAAAVKNYSDSWNAQVKNLMNQPELANDPARYQATLNAIMLNELPKLLKGAPSISIAPLSWKNEKGESTFNLTSNFNDPASVVGEPQTLAAVVDRVLKNLSSKLVINMPMATEVMRNVGLAEGYSSDDAQKLADQQVKGMAAMGQMFHLTQQQDNNITTSLSYGNGQVNMNGNSLTLEQFLMRYVPVLPTSEGMPQ